MVLGMQKTPPAEPQAHARKKQNRLGRSAGFIAADPSRSELMGESQLKR